MQKEPFKFWKHKIALRWILSISYKNETADGNVGGGVGLLDWTLSEKSLNVQLIWKRDRRIRLLVVFVSSVLQNFGNYHRFSFQVINSINTFIKTLPAILHTLNIFM